MINSQSLKQNDCYYHCGRSVGNSLKVMDVKTSGICHNRNVCNGWCIWTNVRIMKHFHIFFQYQFRRQTQIWQMWMETLMVFIWTQHDNIWFYWYDSLLSQEGRSLNDSQTALFFPFNFKSNISVSVSERVSERTSGCKPKQLVTWSFQQYNTIMATLSHPPKQRTAVLLYTQAATHSF